jgi:hypothetical protein
MNTAVQAEIGLVVGWCGRHSLAKAGRRLVRHWIEF